MQLHVRRQGRNVPLYVENGCVTVYIKGYEVPALIDTGASISVIRKDFLSTIRVPVLKCTPCSIKIHLADGSITHCTERVVIPFSVAGEQCVIEFKVMASCSRPLILGVDFLEKYEGEIKYNNKALDLIRPIRAVTGLTLPPMTEVTMTAKVISERKFCPGHDVGVTENLDRGVARQVPFLVKRTLTTPDQHRRIAITLLNCTNHIRRVKRGQVVALYVPQQSADILEISAASLNCLGAPWGHSPPARPPTAPTTLIADPSDEPESVLSSPQKVELGRLLDNFTDVFVGPDGMLGLTDLMEHKIQIEPNAAPLAQMPYRVSPVKRSAISDIVKEQQAQGVIERTDTGEWSSPAFLVPKPNGQGWRLVVDYRRVNSVTKPQYANIPRIDDTLDALGEAKPKIFSCLDLQSGFHQVPIRAEDRDYTAFMTGDGRFRYKVLAMGLKNSPRAFQSLMDVVLSKVAYKTALCYIDDIIIYSRTFEKHLSHLAEVFQLLRGAKLKLKRSKCKFGVGRIKYLGFIISEEGISPCDDKISAIKTFPVPINIRDVRSFCGLAQFYRKFIKNFAGIARPLYNLLKGGVKFIWSSECQQAFDTLKGALTGTSILIYPDFNKEFLVATDASDISLGATLSQKDDEGRVRPIAYAGRSLKPAEKNYTVTHRELLAVVWAVEHFRVYLESSRFKIYTDHAALTHLLKQKHAHQRLIRWQILLHNFDFDILHVQGKQNVGPDVLSRRDYARDDTEADRRINEVPNLLSLEMPRPQRVSFGKVSWIPDQHATVRALTRAQAARRDAPQPPVPDPEPAPPADPPVQIVPAVEAPPCAAPLTAKQKQLKRLRLAREKVCEQMTRMRQAVSLDLAPASLRRLQKQDMDCQDIIKFINHRTLPDDDYLKRWLVLHRDRFLFHEGILYEISAKDRLGEPTIRVVAPQVLQLPIMNIYHNIATSAHPGIANTIDRIKHKFYWWNLNQDVEKYVRSCHKCLKFKQGQRTIRPPLTIRDPAPAPFTHVTLDTLTCGKTKEGWTYVHVLVEDRKSVV